jgi:DNA helicase HerA-like ATPase
MTEKLGIVVTGSLNKGVEVRLDSSASVEDMAVGRYVTIQGQKRRFFGMITDVSLGVIDETITQTPPDVSDPFMAEVLIGTSTYGTLHVQPYLTLSGDTESLLEGPQPVKTVPSHFSLVRLASDRDIELVFGKEDKERFWIGNPLDMETKLCLNLEEFVRRSNGIFGKSGTGKTFLTRILLIGLLQKSKAVNLVFDMHNEYGWAGTREGGPPVKGLKQLFQSNIAVFTLDEPNSRHRGVSTDAVVKIGFSEIEPEDIRLLRQTLNLTEPAIEATYQLYRRFGKDWIQSTLKIGDFESLPEGLNIHESTFKNLQRGLATIQRFPFIQPQAPGNTAKDILEYLDRGINVVLEFGRYRDIAAYILVANMLSRRIYAHYQARMEEAMASAQESAKPRPLVITIEEAHKFLNPEVASQTIFGVIAREMRKYNVTLLVIDQRPSGIDEEIMSQLGTKITCLQRAGRGIRQR